MQLIQNALFILAAALLLLAFYLVWRGDWKRVVHLVADATLFIYVGYVGIGPLPSVMVVVTGAALVAFLLAFSGWLYNKEGQRSNSVLAYLGAFAVSGVTVAYYMGYL